MFYVSLRPLSRKFHSMPKIPTSPNAGLEVSRYASPSGIDDNPALPNYKGTVATGSEPYGICLSPIKPIPRTREALSLSYYDLCD